MHSTLRHTTTFRTRPASRKRKAASPKPQSKSKRKREENQTTESRDSHAYFQHELNKQAETLPQKNEKVAELNEDAPDHLMELLLRFKDKNRNVLLFYGIFFACLFIQFVQLYLVRIFMADDAIKMVSEIDKWVGEGLLNWANGARSSYKVTDEIEFLAALRNGTLVLTDEGFGVAWLNQFIGLPLSWLFLVSEINAIFFKNEYHFKGFAYNGAPAVLVLFLQIIVAFWVAFACSGSVMNSSLDTVATIQASIEAFFVLEIDDKLLPVLWTIVAPKVAQVEDREEAVRLSDHHGVNYELSVFLTMFFAAWAVGRTFYDAAPFFFPTLITPLESAGYFAWALTSGTTASFVIGLWVTDPIGDTYTHGFGNGFARAARRVYNDLVRYLVLTAVCSWVTALLSPFEGTATPFTAGAVIWSIYCVADGIAKPGHTKRYFAESAICLGLALLLSPV